MPKASASAQIERPGTPAESKLSYPPQPAASIKIYFSNSLHRRKKPPYLCNPLQPEAARLENRSENILKNFSLKNLKVGKNH
jgi:hypothetical protein